jgi:phosphotriesterase-related protein
MNRRDFVGAVAVLAGLRSAPQASGDSEVLLRVMTVCGPISPEQTGLTLPHEHVLVDFIGADRVARDRYDADEVVRLALPHLRRIREQGVQTLVECTPAFLGRDPILLRRLAEASGLHLLTNTGYYGANGGKHLPAHARTESAEALAQRWIREWHDGIEETGIRPGLIKIGTDAGPLPGVNRKLVQAAARTHLASGLTIAAHTGDGRAAIEELTILKGEGVDAAAFIWVHAQNEHDPALHVRAAESGAWVEFDGISSESITRHVELVQAMRARGLLGRVLLSHDAGWYHVGEPGGGTFRPFDTLMSQLVPALRGAGFTAEEVRQLTVDNPRAAFTIGIRRTR